MRRCAGNTIIAKKQTSQFLKVQCLLGVIVQLKPIKSLASAGFDLVALHPRLVLLVISFLYYATYVRYNIDLDDEGLLLWGASDILHGGPYPVVDYFAYMPLSYFSLAGISKIFGEHVLVERFFLMAFVLSSGQFLFYLARRFLVGGWIVIPLIAYAVAPGPWYKVFFIWAMLLLAISIFYWLDRPNARRAIVFGAGIGLAASARLEAGIIGLVMLAGVHVLVALDRWWATQPLRLLQLAGSVGAASLGLIMTVSVWLPVYAAVGKLDALATAMIKDPIRHLFSGVLLLQGGLTPFAPLSLIQHPSLEQAFYAINLAAVMAVALIAVLHFFSDRDPATRKSTVERLTLVALAAASMTYAFPYVWNSRILSTFAICYITFAIEVQDVSRQFRRWFGGFGMTAGAAGCCIMLGTIAQLALSADYWGGSIALRRGQFEPVDHPALGGMLISPVAAQDIKAFWSKIQSAPASATIVAGSEATTMGYLSRLHNPTHYRLFVGEFGDKGEDERAVATFDKLRIDYFVARRSQFLEGGGFSSNLKAYAPKIRQYLIDHYNILPLGPNYVLLKRHGLY